MITMSFIIVALMNTKSEAKDYEKIFWWAKVGCVFRDLTRTDKDKVVFTELPKRQNGKMSPKV